MISYNIGLLLYGTGSLSEVYDIVEHDRVNFVVYDNPLYDNLITRR